MSREYYPPSGSDYFQSKMSYQLYFDNKTFKVRITQYEPDKPNTPDTVIDEVLWNVEPNSFMWIDFSCRGASNIQYLDLNENVLSFETRGESSLNLQNGDCKGGTVEPSNFNEEDNKYKDDTFGGTKNESSTPEKPDGSGGGDNETGYLGDGKDKHPSDPNGGNGGDNGSGGSDSSCSTAVCECIEALKKVNESIKGSIDSNGNKLSDISKGVNGVKESIDKNGAKLSDMSSALDSILGEMQTDANVNTGSVPDVDMPSSDGRIEKHKPKEEPVFKDDGDYFKDGGSAEVPEEMPYVPEPVDCWTAVGEQCKEDDGTAEKELDADKFDKDNELDKDKFDKDDELAKDKFDKDDELSKDKFAKDDELSKDKVPSKDSELDRDFFEKDGELSKDKFAKDDEMSRDEFEKDGQLSKDSELGLDKFDRDSILDLDKFNKDKEMDLPLFEKDLEMPKLIYYPTENYDFTNDNFNRNHFYYRTNVFDLFSWK